MGILCVDVGRGTRDILYYEKGKKIENCSTLVLPSWSSLVRGELEAALEVGQTPVFFGGNMGGFSLKKYRSSSRRIMATPQAATTFNDDPDQWEGLGLEIVEDLDSLKGNFCFIETRDIDLQSLCRGLSELGVCLELEGVAIAVQDHGKAPSGVSDRRFRFQRYEDALRAGLHPADFVWPAEELPPYLTRMISTAERLKNQANVLLMDSGMAALAGALEDPVVSRAELKIIVNVGNSHTLAAFLHGEKILGLIEHHTGLLDGGKICTLIEDLASGEVNGERIFQEGGHGGICLDYSFPGMNALELVCVTGPNRDMLSSEQVYFTAPYGNMMLTGAYGLLRAHQRFFG